MNGLVKEYKKLFLICLAAAIVSLSYAITYRLPDYLGIEGLYSMLNNIAISYIAAFIFFLLQVYLPDCNNRKQAQAILYPQFADLVEFIEEIIAVCRRYIIVDGNDRITVAWRNKEDKVLYYVTEPEEATKTNSLVATKKSKDDFIKLGNTYDGKIKAIKDRIHFKNCSPDILNALSELELSKFFSQVLPMAFISEDSFIGFPGFKKSVDDLEEAKNAFKTRCGISNTYTVRDANEKEIAISETLFCKQTWQTPTLEHFNESLLRQQIKLQLQKMFPEDTVNQVLDEIVISKEHKNELPK